MSNIQFMLALPVHSSHSSSKRCVALVAILIVLGFALPALAQQQYSEAPPEDTTPRSVRQMSQRISASDAELSDDADMSVTGEKAVLPAGRIISILRQQPELIESAKTMLAQRSSIDPSTISDEALYSRIRQDASLRTEITQELSAQGYDLSGELDRDVESDEEYSAASSSSSKLPSSSNLSDERYANRRTQESGRYAGRRVQEDEDVPEDYNDAKKGAWRADGVNGRTKRHADELDQERNGTHKNRNLNLNKDRDDPQVNHRQNPYRAIPSLRDLYVQVPATEAPLRRFGSDTFRLGTGNAERLPMDLPVGPDYVLGPGDVLVVNMWGSQSLRLNRTIDRQGQIALPEAGTVTLAGLTIAKAQEAVQKALSSQYQSMHVELSLGRVRTVRVYVVGDVQRPGAYDVSSLSTPLNALYAAGGPTSHGSIRVLQHKRGEQLVKQIDLYDFLLQGVRYDVDRLLPGDTLLVPPVGPQVSVIGMVRRPAIYEVKSGESLKDILDLAGGMMVSAALGKIDVERIDAHQRRTMLNVQLPDGNQAEMVGKLSAFQVQDGDHVRVSPILPYNENVVYLDGHVFRPGKFAFREGMTVTDLVHSYQDVLPEPANHAEIIRLQTPDFRPTMIEFDLSAVLSGDDPIRLQPLDVVRIFSRYEIDPPKVSIQGEVLRPGKYPLANGMTVSSLVKMAGGFRRSAYKETADLTSYVVQNGSNVLSKVTRIDLANALEGDRAADIVLKPGDVLGIRQLSGWNDIGAAIKISGEVMYPGTYGIATGERLSAVLKRAGGFRLGAYPEGAVLERVQVREMGEKSRHEMIRRLETSNPAVSAGMNTGQEQLALMQAMQAQQQQTLTALRTHPASGRLVIRVSSDISKWENTTADVELRPGDVLSIPKRPSFVIISGQVYNPSALTYVPGKTAGWYLRKAGGPTDGANKKGIFVLRVDGSVMGVGTGLFTGGALAVRLRPGDAIIVPEKLVGGSMFWRNMMTTAQVLSSIATTAALAAASM